MYSFVEISDAGAIQDYTQTIIMVESAAIMSGVSSQLQADEKLLPEHFLVTIGKKKNTSALCVVSQLLCSLSNCGCCAALDIVAVSPSTLEELPTTLYRHSVFSVGMCAYYSEYCSSPAVLCSSHCVYRHAYSVQWGGWTPVELGGLMMIRRSSRKGQCNSHQWNVG